MCDPKPELTDPNFRLWLINKAKSIKPSELVEDDYFVSRLAGSIQKGRSVRFNQQEKEGGRNSALSLLREEYNKEQGGTNA
jgi:hypothetical protein